MMNLYDALKKQIENSYSLLEMYEQIPTGNLGAMLIRRDVKEAEKALRDNDPISMMQSLETLKGHK